MVTISTGPCGAADVLSELPERLPTLSASDALLVVDGPGPERWVGLVADPGDSELDRASDDPRWRELAEAKRGYHLFRPTPRSLRREFLTDRPDKTLTPITVDAGHIQFETDLASLRFDREQQPQEQGLKDQRSDSYLLTNLRIGLTNFMDLHIILRPWERLEQPAANPVVLPVPPLSASGWGDMAVLFKQNLWGNEGGPTAFGLAQRIDIPAGDRALTSGFVEGGVSGFWLRRWPGKTYLGIECGVDIKENIRDLGYHAEFLNSISLAWGLSKSVSTKVELASVTSTESGQPWEGVFAAALLWNPCDDWQFDIGLNKGLTIPATDINPYVGFAVRY